MMVVTRQGAGRAAANKRGAAGRLAAGLAGIAVAGLLASTLALAQDSYPSKPIRLLVSDTPGSAPDVLARKVAPEEAARIELLTIQTNSAFAGQYAYPNIFMCETYEGGMEYPGVVFIGPYPNGHPYQRRAPIHEGLLLPRRRRLRRRRR